MLRRTPPPSRGVAPAAPSLPTSSRASSAPYVSPREHDGDSDDARQSRSPTSVSHDRPAALSSVNECPSAFSSPSSSRGGGGGAPAPAALSASAPSPLASAGRHGPLSSNASAVRPRGSGHETAGWHAAPAGPDLIPAAVVSAPREPPRTAPLPAPPTTAATPSPTARGSAAAHAPPPPPRTHYQYLHSFEYRSRLSVKMRTLYGAATVPVIVEPTESNLRSSPPPPGPPASAPRTSAGNSGSSYNTSVGGRGAFGPYATNGSGGIGAALSTMWPGAHATAAAAPPPPSALASPSTRSTLKCVLPRAKSIMEVILTLRDRLALDAGQSLFLYVGDGDVLVPGNCLLGDLYERYHNADGFLYLGYLLENTFGGRRGSA